MDVNRGEHELQLLRRLRQMYVDRANKGETTNLDDIKNKALASKPPFASSLAFMWQFAMKFTGGSKAPMMEETEAFMRALGELFRRNMQQPTNTCSLNGAMLF